MDKIYKRTMCIADLDPGFPLYNKKNIGTKKVPTLNNINSTLNLMAKGFANNLTEKIYKIMVTKYAIHIFLGLFFRK